VRSNGELKARGRSQARLDSTLQRLNNRGFNTLDRTAFDSPHPGFPAAHPFASATTMPRRPCTSIQLLRWCTQAYEQSPGTIRASGHALFFPSPEWRRGPVGPADHHCSADFLRPLACGDKAFVSLRPCPLDSGRFDGRPMSFRRSNRYSQEVARASPRHLAIDHLQPAAAALPAAAIDQWLQGSGQGPKPKSRNGLGPSPQHGLGTDLRDVPGSLLTGAPIPA